MALTLALALLLSILSGPDARADWPQDGVGLAPYVPPGSSNASDPQIIPDGLGGSIIVWTDYRGTGGDIYAQRVSAGGAALWTANGVPLSTAADAQIFPSVISDGSGGAIVTWTDRRSGVYYDIYAQRVSANGVVQWTTDGLPLCAAANSQDYPQIAADGAGGAIVAWKDSRGGIGDIYAQRVSANGVVQWAADGVPLCVAPDAQEYPEIAADGSGGAIVTWYDGRGGAGSSDIYAQRVNSNGTVQWASNGVPICAAANFQYDPHLVSDGSGGAIVTWSDHRSVADYDIYAQRVNASGAVQWTADGVPLSSATGDQDVPQIAPDGSGGAIVAWRDSRSGNRDIYAQRVNSNGAVQWTSNGVPVCSVAYAQESPRIVPLGGGEVVVTWTDGRNGYNDIYAQRVNASGANQWTSGGVPVCTAASAQNVPKIVSDGSGGVIITWDDGRSGNTDIYVQRVTPTGAMQWTIDGVSVCREWLGPQSDARIVPDGMGGAIVTWVDARNDSYDIYAQRVSASGAMLWGPGGVPVCAAATGQWIPEIVPDGSGGAIVAWADDRNGPNWWSHDLYAQRVNASGVVQWAADGVPLCTAVSNQGEPQMIPDGSGGAIVTWIDDRNGDNNNFDVYAQRVSGTGAVQWAIDGVPLCNAPNNQAYVQITPDGSAGAIVTWADGRSDVYDIYAQRVSADGVVQWTTDGVPMAIAANEQDNPQIAPDGSGGAIITWHDARNGYASYDIYAQRVSAGGAVQWTTNGVPLCTAENGQIYPQIATDSSGDAIVTWTDSRNGTPLIYLQRVSAGGAVQWTTDGMPLWAQAAGQDSPQILSVGSVDAIIAWADGRNGYNDIYAQRVDANGTAQWNAEGVPLCRAANGQNYPQIAADPSECAIVIWMDERSGDGQIYAQRTECATPSGACCLHSGACMISTESECAGTWLGEWTACDANPCPQPDLLLEDDFEFYGNVTANGWTAHNAGGTNPIAATPPGLTYPEYPCASGNSASMTTSGEDDHRSFATQSAGSVYYAFLVNLSAAQATGDYFIHLSRGTNYYARVYAKLVSGQVSFGVNRQNQTPINYSTTTFPLNTTHLVVVKYTFVPGDANDTVDLFVDPAVGATEPAPLLSATDVASADATALEAIALRQGSAGNAPTQRVDGIRVGTSWTDIFPVAADLVVQSCDPDTVLAGQPVTLTIVIRNQGSGAAPATKTWVALDGNANCDQINTPALQPGESVQVYCAFGPPSVGIHEVEILADATGLVDEASETNNTLTHHLVVQDPASGVDGPGEKWETALLGVVPNPSSGSVAIRYSLAEGMATRIEIFDAGGRRVRSFQGTPGRAGVESLVWDGLGESGRRVGSGSYYVRFRAGNQSWTRTIVLLR